MTTILIADDNEDIRDMVDKMLQHHGFAVLKAATGQQAVDIAIDSHPALILMDINMPELDGWEATSQLRKHPATADVPIIALTAHAMVDDRPHAQQVGCNAYHTKPIDFESLLDQIVDLLVS
ncbi:MAG: response regulator [Pirellulaceae bacterium]